ncbi:MAG: gamma carbonic anhydrase family protein [Candidatus Aminicenantaceae bacterium]
MPHDFSKRLYEIHKETFIAPSASIIGKVIIKKGASIWYNSVLRGDIEDIIIGEDSNIQDNCVVHVESDLKTIVGKGVTVGHNVVLHACSVGDHCLIGMGSILMDGSVIGKNSLVAAGSLVPPGKKYPEGSFILGTPAVVNRQLTEKEIERIKEGAIRYRKYWEAYVKNGIPEK